MKAITAVKPGDSFDHWHHVTCRQFSLTECSKAADRHFRARVTIRQLGALALCSIWSATRNNEVIRVVRRPTEIRKDQRDYFMFWLMLEGTAGLQQEGRYAGLKGGDMVLQDQSRPFELELGQVSQAAMVMIPRPLLTCRLPAAQGMAARRIAASSRMGPITGTFLRQLFAIDESIEDTAGDATDRRLSASTLDIISTMLEAEAGLESVALLESRLYQVKEYMLARIHDCEIDIGTIARGTSMAPRTLHRLFAREGTTPIQWLWEQRLTASYRMLSEATVARITDVAISCGFKDVSHFSRAFRGRFGVAPSSLGRRK